MNKNTKATLVRSFSQQDIDFFARLSGDNNPIHVDPEFSARSRFGRPVAHGLLLCSVLRGLLEQLLPGSRLSEQTVMFPAPTFADENMRFSVSLSAADLNGSDQTTTRVRLEVSRVVDNTVTCQGHSHVLK